MPNDDDAILAHPTGYPQNLTIAERKRIWLLIHAGQQMRPSGSLDDFTREQAVDNLLEKHWTAHKGELERLLALQQIDERGVTVLRRDAPAEALESITGIRRGRSRTKEDLLAIPSIQQNVEENGAKQCSHPMCHMRLEATLVRPGQAAYLKIPLLRRHASPNSTA